MAMERVILAVIISSTLISMASAIDGTATFNTIYVRKYTYIHCETSITYILPATL